MKIITRAFRSVSSNQTIGVSRIIGILFVMYAGYKILSGSLIDITILIAGVAALLVSMKFPSLTVFCLVLLAVPGFLPAVVLELNPLPAFFPVDLLVLIMATATIIKFIFCNKHKSADLRVLFVLILLFGAYFFFEIGRNYTQYGASAPGEVRFRYFYLIPPLYIALFFNTEKSRRTLLKVLLLSSFLGGLFVFYIEFFSDIARIFQEGHFVGVNISLGIAYGFLAFYLSRRYHLLKTNVFVFFLIAIATFISIICDQTRSVWLVCLVLIALLVISKEILRNRFSVFVLVLSVISLAYFVMTEAGADIARYLGIRALGLTNPMEDPNASWRIFLWQAYINRIWEAPILGEGFGGHWDIYVPELGQRVTVAPHNFYVMTLVKMGIAGLALYLTIVITIGKKYMLWLRSAKRINNKEIPLVLTALMILIANHFFYMVFSSDYYAWIFIGLGMAVVRNSNIGSDGRPYS